ncbi:hypothetical protein F1D61_18790 [Methylobacterium aquaticum]|nr:hypothetical protein F1D61_18790 [Methylobacterium aquaticum]
MATVGVCGGDDRGSQFALLRLGPFRCYKCRLGGGIARTRKSYQWPKMLTHRPLSHLEFSMPSQRLDENSRTEPKVVSNDRWYHSGWPSMSSTNLGFFSISASSTRAGPCGCRR